MDRLRFGTAGIPLSAKHLDTVDGVKEVRKHGLDAMELEFVQNVNVSGEKAPIVKKAAKDSDVVLSCHGQYYVNLNSPDKAKLEASKKRIISACIRASECGVFSITYHLGYYMGRHKQEAYKNVEKALEEILEVLKSEKVDIELRPEIAGKTSQFGDLEEVIKLSQKFDSVWPCIDFAHLHARTLGKFNTYQEFCKVLEELEKGLGKQILHNMHIQVAGIEYGKTGERNHTNLKDCDLNYKDLVRSWRDFNIKGVVISESPNIEGDALLLKREWEKV